MDIFVSDKTFVLPCHLKEHAKIHTRGKGQCNICGKEFADPHYLRKHIRTHSGNTPHKCMVCNKGFIQVRV